MGILCFFGRHVPSSVSVRFGKRGEYLAHCEGCAVPLERDESGRWRPTEPLVQRHAR